MLDIDDPGQDYELAWPRELFVSEARAILRMRADNQGDAARLLLGEAFSSDIPRADYQSDDAGDPWSRSAFSGGFLESLVEHAERLPERSAPRPYWRERGGKLPKARLTAESPELVDEWSSLVWDLQRAGYFDRVAPRPCVDDDGPRADPGKGIAHEISRRAGGLALDTWPPSPFWSGKQDEFYDLVEVVHDLVARPRRSWFHDHGNCGWHYSQFSTAAGQALYRWRVNELMERYGTGVELADSGEDRGRLVHVPSGGRIELLVNAVDTSPTAAGRSIVEHAIALFRARSATREDKRSACIALAGVLEERREQLKTDLLSKDEGALFQIANQFAVRHRRADQHPNYDEAYLDWLFWWYLATVELSNRLLAREAGEAGSSR